MSIIMEGVEVIRITKLEIELTLKIDIFDQKTL